jgi:hypothetical protein
VALVVAEDKEKSMRIKAVDIDVLIDAFRERAKSLEKYRGQSVKVDSIITFMNETADEFERVYGKLPSYVDKCGGDPS